MRAAARRALSLMDANGLAVAVIMSAPHSELRRPQYDYLDLSRAAKWHAGRFVFLGGGASLNPIIHQTPAASVTPEKVASFRRKAERMLDVGARGFGEMSALHFSFRSRHPFNEAAPDHPLFLELAQIAGRRGVPIDLHMEAAPIASATPQHIAKRSSANPAQVRANIAGLKRLLSSAPKAPIIWAHAGWDNTGARTPRLMRDLLKAHPNLFMSMKFRKPGRGRNNPLDKERKLKPAWLRLLKDFPDRFLLATDTHVYASAERETRFTAGPAAGFLKQLPPGLRDAVCRRNAARLFKLDL